MKQSSATTFITASACLLVLRSIGTAAGSLGQFVMVPLGQAFGLMAAALHWPVSENPVRMATRPA